jgi:hypothetical protein
MKTKMCVKCLEEKSVDVFPLQGRKSTSGTRYKVRRSECRDCYNVYMREYQKGRQEHKDLVKKSKHKKLQHVQKIKKDGGCCICGYNKCVKALHFHHLNPQEKSYEITWGCFRGKSLDSLNKEMDKCVILCANCHAEVEEGITELLSH